MPALSKLVVELGLDNNKFTSGLNKSMGGLAKFGIGVAGLGIAVGAGLLKIGSDWDAASDTIITKTGASGKALTDLQDTTKSVFKSIPTSMQTAADAVSTLSVTTGATGKNLDLLAASEIELARITKTDLTSNMAASAKIFNSFGVSVKDQSTTLDAFFRVSQKTGIGIDVLMQEVEQFNPQLKQMGLNATQGANLIGKIDKAGGHASLIFRGMTKATNDWNKAGIPFKKGMTDAYNSIFKAGTAAQASAIAVKLFGGKAGPELAQMIRDGTISVDDLTGALTDNGATILETAGATNDFSENFKIFKNNIEAALIPLGSLVFNGLNLLIPLLTTGVDAITKFASALGQAYDTGRQTSTIVSAFPGILQPVVTVFLEVADAVGDVIRAFGKNGLQGAFDAIGPAISQIWDSLKGLGSQVIDLAGWTLNIGIPKFTGWLVNIGYDVWKWLKGAMGLGPAITGDGTGGPTTDRNISLTDWVFDIAIPSFTGWVVDIGYDIWGWLRGALGLGPQLTGDGTGGPASDKNISLSDWVLDIAIPKISAVAGDVIQWIQDWIDKHPEVSAKLKLWVLNLGDPNVNVPNLDMTVSHEANKRSTTAIITDWYLTIKGEPKTSGNQQDAQSSMQKWMDSFKFALTPRNIVVNTPVISEIVGFPKALNNALNALEPARTTLDKMNIDFSGLKTMDLNQFGIDLGMKLGKSTADANVGQTISDAVKTSADAVADWSTTLYDKGVDVITGLNNGLAAAWPLITASINGAVVWMIAAFATAQDWLNDAGQRVITGLNDGLAAAWNLIPTSIQGAISWILTAFGRARDWLNDAGQNIIGGLNDGLAAAWYLVRDSVSGAASYITGAFDGVSLYDIGYSILQSLYQGMSDKWDVITGWLSGLNPANYKGPPARDEKMLVNSGVLIMKGLSVGLDRGWSNVSNQLSGYSPMISGGSAFNGGSGSFGSSSGGVTNNYGDIHITVSGAGDPDAVADRVFAKFSRSLSLQGAA